MKYTLPLPRVNAADQAVDHKESVVAEPLELAIAALAT